MLLHSNAAVVAPAASFLQPVSRQPVFPLAANLRVPQVQQPEAGGSGLRGAACGARELMLYCRNVAPGLACRVAAAESEARR